MKVSEEQWRQAVLSTGASIAQAIQILNEIAIKIVIITDEVGSLIGTISDGDIRRGLLKGLGLQSPIDGIIHHNVLIASPELSRDMVVQLMLTNKIQQIPIVDNSGCVIGIHLWDELSAPSSRENTMVIMAGGKGTRLYPQTEHYPKPLLKVAGRPILEHIITRAKREGFLNFILAVYYLGDMIESYFGNGERFGVSINYLREDAPLGTAGALGLLSPLPDSTLIVTNGDVITDIHYGDLLDFHKQHSAQATMAVRTHKWQNPFGTVQIEGFEIVGYEEKPVFLSQINAGVYAIEPSALNFLQKNTACDMPTLFERLKNDQQRVVAYPLHESWIDIGRPEDLKKANEEID